MKEKNVTILVNSCDKYEDAWDPFFKLLKVQWPDCPYDMVLSTETKSYKCDCFDVKTVNSPPELSWSARLKDVLTKIETEYVLFFLEDFFLLEKVRVDIFNKALEIVEKDKNICAVQFPCVELNYKKNETTEDIVFEKVKLFKPYRAKVMVTLWRKKDFENLIFENEDPWICERETSIRSIAYNKKIYTQNHAISVPAFYYYINPELGFGITGGKWLKNNKEFFEKNGILGVNYDSLGIEKCAETYKQIENRRSMKRKENVKSILQSGCSFKTIKELLYIFKRQVLKKLKIDLLINICKYRKIYKKKK